VNWRVSTEEEVGNATLELGKVELADRAALAGSNAASDWLCAWCLNHVARERDRFAYDGRDEFVFTNPDGIRFEIITFSQTIGCREAGEPTLEHTWFPGHAWSFCLCDRCGQHLGWCYSGVHEFVGLIKNRIVRAVAIMN
jgi:hypothetical protein